MAERNPQVMEMVEKELGADPAVKTESLFEKARTIDPSIGELTLRQFHARYPLPLKRKRSTGKRAGGRAGKRPPAKGAAAKGAAGKRTAGASGTRGGAPGTRTRDTSDATPRDRVRRVFLEFASDLTRAESRASMVDVLAALDQYVDRAIDSAKR